MVGGSGKEKNQISNTSQPANKRTGVWIPHCALSFSFPSDLTNLAPGKKWRKIGK